MISTWLDAATPLNGDGVSYGEISSQLMGKNGDFSYNFWYEAQVQTT